MAARKLRKVPARPASASTPSEADPQSWLYLNPAGPSTAGTVFGVLRRAYGGRTNSAIEFGYRKAHVGAVTDGVDVRVWAPNVERIEVLLPAGADDSLADPATLLGQMDAHAVDREKALLTCLTLPLRDAERVHVAWERARAFLRERFARDRQLASILVLHAPGTINAPFPLHSPPPPTRLSSRGGSPDSAFEGLYDEDLIHDGGQAIVEAMWAEHVGSFR